jgi:hypothetical protein
VRLSRAALDAPWLREAVLDHLGLFLVTARDRTPLHAAAIARRGVALVLVGPSGLGKSSLTFAGWRAGWSVLAEDVVFVQLEPERALWSLPRGIHLSPSATRHFPELEHEQPVTRPDGRLKLRIQVPSGARAPMPWRGPTALCLLDREAPGEPTLSVVGAPDAAAQARATLQGGFHRFDHLLDRCIRAVGAAGCWRLRRNAAPGRLLDALEGLVDELTGSGTS